jgi:hypothetical protein
MLVLVSLILSETLGEEILLFHFTDKATKAHRGFITFPRVQNYKMVSSQVLEYLIEPGIYQSLNQSLSPNTTPFSAHCSAHTVPD